MHRQQYPVHVEEYRRPPPPVVKVFGRSDTLSDTDSGCSVDDFVWFPAGLAPEQVRLYFRQLPDDRVPYAGSEGEQWRLRALLWQLPVHDSETRFCHQLTELETDELLTFKTHRQQNCLGRGRVIECTSGTSCHNCQKNIFAGQLCVTATRLPKFRWHPACFTCDVCHDLLVDLTYFAQDDVVFCGRHHAERWKPRCPACDELIFSEECTEAEGASFHMDHFTCVDCGVALAGQRYVMQQASPFCVVCYNASHAEICVVCNGSIKVDDEHVADGGLSWHQNCFRCIVCDLSLQKGNFIRTELDIYCSSRCQSAVTGDQCSDPGVSQSARGSQHLATEALPQAPHSEKPRRRVHFPRSVSFPAEPPGSQESGSSGREGQSTVVARQRKNHPDDCSTCSSSDSEEFTDMFGPLPTGPLPSERVSGKRRRMKNKDKCLLS